MDPTKSTSTEENGPQQHEMGESEGGKLPPTVGGSTSRGRNMIVGQGREVEAGAESKNEPEKQPRDPLCGKEINAH